jgi:hypothetical protein
VRPGLISYSYHQAPSDHSQLSSHLFGSNQDLIQLVLGLGGHITRPEQFPFWRHSRADDRIDKDPIFGEELAHLVRFEGVFNNDRNERNVSDLFAHQFENRAAKIAGNTLEGLRALELRREKGVVKPFSSRGEAAFPLRWGIWVILTPSFQTGALTGTCEGCWR